MTNEIYFDNILLSSDESVAKQIGEQWAKKYKIEEKVKEEEEAKFAVRTLSLSVLTC